MRGRFLIRIVGEPVLDGIPRHVGNPGPLQCYAAVARHGGQNLGLVVLGAVRDDFLQELHLGDGDVIRAAGGGRDGDGHLFDRHLLTQVDRNHPRSRSSANGVNPGGEGSVERNGLLRSVRQLYLSLAGLNGAAAVGTGNLNDAGLHGGGQLDGENDIPASGGRRQGYGPFRLEQAVRVTPTDGERGGVQHGGNGGGGIQHLSLTGVSTVVVDIRQVRHIQPAVAIEVKHRQSGAVGILPQLCIHGVQIGAVHYAVTVDVAQGEGAVSGAHNQVLGVLVQSDGGLEGLVACAGELHGIRLSGGQAGELRLIIAHPLLRGQRLAVHIFHFGVDAGGQLVGLCRTRRKGNCSLTGASAYLEPDIAAGGVFSRLRQVKPEGDSDGAGGPRLPLDRPLRCESVGQARHEQGARQQKAERFGEETSYNCHILPSFLLYSIMVWMKNVWKYIVRFLGNDVNIS